MGVARTAKIVSLAIGLTAFVLLWFFGFAIWVFIPLLPVGVLFVISVLYARQKARAAKPKTEGESKTDRSKAA
jgi:membrane protein implicated in regulation of membrane protease activity